MRKRKTRVMPESLKKIKKLKLYEELDSSDIGTYEENFSNIRYDE